MSVSWQITSSECWLSDQRMYSSVAPDGVAAVLRNLQRYVRLLNASTGSKRVEALYLHNEFDGIVSISQNGVGNYQEDFRIYTFADDMDRVLYLLALGKANERNADMEYCKALVSYISDKKARITGASK
jgi:hypothetical protein